MKIFISADIEGVSGVYESSECRKGGYDYEIARKQMTLEVLAACRGAIKAGAKEILVNDSHGDGGNILYDMLPKEVKIIRGWSLHPYKMMEGLDESFDGVIFIGYHSSAKSGGNPLAHTINSGLIREIKINNRCASEFLINTYTASLEGIPVLFISGDENISKEARNYVEKIVVCPTKSGIGGSVTSKSPTLVIEEIERLVEDSIKNKKEVLRLNLPVKFDLEIEYNKQPSAMKGSFYPKMRLESPYSIKGEFNNYFDVLRALLFLTKL